MAKELATTGAGALGIVPAGDIAAIIAENLGGGSITALDLDRIKLPSGGGIAFEVPGLDGADMAKTLEGVIVHHQDQNAYWVDPNPTRGVPPTCAARDARVGIGEPGGICGTCPLNQFGTAEKGRGKACKNVKILFLLRPGALLPVAVFLPPTSMPVAKQYLLRLTSAGVPFYGVRSRLSLVKATSAEGADYAKIEIAAVPVNPEADNAVGRLSLAADDLSAIKKYREAIIPMLAAVALEADMTAE